MRKIRKKRGINQMKKVKLLLAAAMMAVMFICNTDAVSAASTDTEPISETETKAEREDIENAKNRLRRYYDDLFLRYDISGEGRERLSRIYDNAKSNLDSMEGGDISEVDSYEAQVEGYLSDVASGNISIDYVDSENKEYIRSKLKRYYDDLKIRYSLTDEKISRMDKVYNSAMDYMENTSLDEEEISSYESEIEGYLLDIAKENSSGTEKFLMLSNEVPILGAQYGEQTFVVLSLINLGKTDITDVVVTPTVSNDRKEWPFNIQQAYDAQTIQIIQAADNIVDAYSRRMDIGWYFTVRNDVLTGCYPLKFHAKYYQNGEPVETDIITYINIKGSNPKKQLVQDESEQAKTSNPRIIVTGYRTDPEEVYAGTTFNLTVSVKNTSKDTAVENVLFNMEATVEGSSTEASYAAFLPTSGSSSVYIERIAPGATYDMSIEMEAKSDLAQKPYVLTVNMKYDTEDAINLSDVAEVSVPIKQEAKLDTSSAEVMPESIEVGGQSNVMFSIYNTGKTTLYNVKVNYEGDTIESGISYVGNITPGETGNVDSMLTGIAPDMGEGVIKAVITYEDESGNETSFEKEINLSVYEVVYDDGGMYEDPGMYEEPQEESKGFPMIAIGGIILAVVIIIVIVVIVIKKKKKAKQHKEDLELLEESENEDDL